MKVKGNKGYLVVEPSPQEVFSKEDNLDIQGIVFDIKRYAIHDGPGIRTTVFLKGCPLGCLWCDNPEGQFLDPEVVWLAPKCIDCGTCLEVCPEGAIKKESSLLVTDKSKCKAYGKCVKLCRARAREIKGEKMTVGEVVDIVERDSVFYWRSGGGITLSGGEPLSQPKFSLEILKECKQRYIHTAIETSGFCEFDDLRNCADYLDFIYYDIKHMDEDKHIELTGVSNETIFENLKKLASYLYKKNGKTQLCIRIPIIPKYNDSGENIEKIISMLKDLGGLIDGVELLGYHRLGMSKYPWVGLEYMLSGLEKLKEETLKSIQEKIIKGTGVEVSYTTI